MEIRALVRTVTMSDNPPRLGRMPILAVAGRGPTVSALPAGRKRHVLEGRHGVEEAYRSGVKVCLVCNVLNPVLLLVLLEGRPLWRGSVGGSGLDVDVVVEDEAEVCQAAEGLQGVDQAVLK